MKKKEKVIKEMKKMMSQTQGGFTYVETLVCLAVVLLLTVVVGIASIKIIDNAKETKCYKEIETFKEALEQYYIDCGRFPSQEQGLDALWEKPYLYPVPAGWNGPYIDTELPADPWGYEYGYRTPGPNNLPYEIFSYGSDGEKGGEGTAEDIYSWKRR